MTATPPRATAKQQQVGNGLIVWFAYADGKMLLDKSGVGRRFKTHSAAIKQAREAVNRELSEGPKP